MTPLLESERVAGRQKTFRVIATMMAISGVVFGIFTGIFGIVSEDQQIHAFHNAVVAALLLVLSAPAAIAAARSREKAGAPVVHLVGLSIAGLGTMLLGQKADIFTLPFLAFVGALVALRVARFDGLAEGRWSLPLAILVAGSSVPLLSYALAEAKLQRIDTSSAHAELNHWVEMSFVAVGVLLLEALAAFRPAAFRLSAWSAGITLAMFGASSLAFSNHASAMSQPWGGVALLGGVVFIAVSELERRRLRPKTA
ncbi:MAG TPA: hypothetical protein VHL54_12625 [Actinomycetota bacterium]|nr:hypothetical protein [Actinomycetota bacterium]